jgi:hypothetical protein
MIIMYKALIVGISAVLIGLAGYAFNKAGIPELVAQNIEQGKDSYGVSALEVFSGVYECVQTSGCKNDTRLVLQQDTTLDISATIDGEELSLGQGTWGIGKDGSLVLMLQNNTGTPGKSLIAKKISSLKISGFSNKKNLFPGMENPTFVRVKEAEVATSTTGGTTTETTPTPDDN